MLFNPEIILIQSKNVGLCETIREKAPLMPFGIKDAPSMQIPQFAPLYTGFYNPIPFYTGLIQQSKSLLHKVLIYVILRDPHMITDAYTSVVNIYLRRETTILTAIAAAICDIRLFKNVNV